MTDLTELRAAFDVAAKPHVGEPVTYEGKVVGMVTSVEGNLCYVDTYNGAPFIWRFRERLNCLHHWPRKAAAIAHMVDTMGNAAPVDWWRSTAA